MEAIFILEAAPVGPFDVSKIFNKIVDCAQEEVTNQINELVNSLYGTPFDLIKIIAGWSKCGGSVNKFLDPMRLVKTTPKEAPHPSHKPNKFVRNDNSEKYATGCLAAVRMQFTKSSFARLMLKLRSFRIGTNCSSFRASFSNVRQRFIMIKLERGLRWHQCRWNVFISASLIRLIGGKKLKEGGNQICLRCRWSL